MSHDEPDEPVSPEALLRRTPPHALIATARALLRERFGAEETTVFMADYGLSVLQPVTVPPHTGTPVPVSDGPAGRAFATQRPHTADAAAAGCVQVHLPMTVRGDRVGVLRVTVPRGAAGPGGVRGLAGFATALGHEMLAADRDTDLYLQARRRKRLTLAAEMQWQLLPGRGCERPEYVIAAHLEPAYDIGGDNFDWAGDQDHLVVTVTDGMGSGISASLLTNLAVSAQRNARRAGLSLSDQARLTDQALYGQYGGKAYASTLLLRFELATGRVQAVDAGSPRLYRMRDGKVEHLPLEAQLPLGMFEETRYEEQAFTVAPGDRLVAVSTGVHGARSGAGVAYGELALRQAVRDTRLGDPYDTAQAVVHGLTAHTGRLELASDATVVCLDWRGRGATAG